MTDNEISTLICAQLDLRMPQDPVLSTVPGLTVVQNYQPRQQGPNADAAIYFVKQRDKRYGFPRVSDAYVAPTPPDPVGSMRHDEAQDYESAYQFMALVPQSPVISGPTESDVLNIVAGILSGDDTRAALRAQGLQILRITDVQNPYWSDETDRWEAAPSFEIVFTHERVRSTVAPVVSTYDASLYRI